MATENTKLRRPQGVETATENTTAPAGEGRRPGGDRPAGAPRRSGIQRALPRVHVKFERKGSRVYEPAQPPNPHQHPPSRRSTSPTRPRIPKRRVVQHEFACAIGKLVEQVIADPGSEQPGVLVEYRRTFRTTRALLVPRLHDNHRGSPQLPPH